MQQNPLLKLYRSYKENFYLETEILFNRWQNLHDDCYPSENFIEP